MHEPQEEASGGAVVPVTGEVLELPGPLSETAAGQANTQASGAASKATGQSRRGKGKSPAKGSGSPPNLPDLTAGNPWIRHPDLEREVADAKAQMTPPEGEDVAPVQQQTPAQGVESPRQGEGVASMQLVPVRDLPTNPVEVVPLDEDGIDWGRELGLDEDEEAPDTLVPLSPEQERQHQELLSTILAGAVRWIEMVAVYRRLKFWQHDVHPETGERFRRFGDWTRALFRRSSSWACREIGRAKLLRWAEDRGMPIQVGVSGYCAVRRLLPTPQDCSQLGGLKAILTEARDLGSPDKYGQVSAGAIAEAVHRRRCFNTLPHAAQTYPEYLADWRALEGAAADDGDPIAEKVIEYVAACAPSIGARDIARYCARYRYLPDRAGALKYVTGAEVVELAERLRALPGEWTATKAALAECIKETRDWLKKVGAEDERLRDALTNQLQELREIRKKKGWAPTRKRGNPGRSRGNPGRSRGNPKPPAAKKEASGASPKDPAVKKDGADAPARPDCLFHLKNALQSLDLCLQAPDWPTDEAGLRPMFDQLKEIDGPKEKLWKKWCGLRDALPNAKPDERPRPAGDGEE
jgi:hypothetical protein